MWQLNIATLIRFFTAVLLAPCGATAKHGNYYDRKFTFFKLEKKYLLAGVIMAHFLKYFVGAHTVRPYESLRIFNKCFIWG